MKKHNKKLIAWLSVDDNTGEFADWWLAPTRQVARDYCNLGHTVVKVVVRRANCDLEAENRRLRKALRFYADAGGIARMALKEKA